jgi:hypothetical protein
VVVEDGVGVGVGILVKAELEGLAGDAPGVTQDAIVPAISKPSPNSNALFTAVLTYATTTTQCTGDRPRASFGGTRDNDPRMVSLVDVLHGLSARFSRLGQ